MGAWLTSSLQGSTFVDGEIISIFVSFEASQVSESEAAERDDSVQEVLSGDGSTLTSVFLLSHSPAAVFAAEEKSGAARGARDHAA